MLTCHQVDRLAQFLYSSDHDCFFDASLRGEPFLEDDIVYFFDGEVVSIVGYTLDRFADNQTVLKRLDAIVENCLRAYRPRLFHYYGPLHIDLKHSLENEYSLVYDIKPNPFVVDMYIDFSDSTVLNTRNAKESLRKTGKRNFNTWIGPRDSLSHEHMDLLRGLASRNVLGLSDVSYFTNITSIIHSQATVFFEAYFCGTLVGFAVAHEFFNRKPFMVFQCSENGRNGVADALYLTAIQYFIERGVHRLGLGYSTSEGTFNFKKKWGGVRCNLPYSQLVWLHRDYKIGDVGMRHLQGFMHWIPRLFILKSSES